MCKLLGAHWSNFSVLFNVYYKIKDKFVPQACNICIFNFQINFKRHLACKPIGKRVCLQLWLQIPSSNLQINITTLHRNILQYCSQKNIRFGSNMNCLTWIDSIYWLQPSSCVCVLLCTSHLKSPHPPPRECAGHSLYPYVKVSDIPRHQRNNMVISPALEVSTSLFNTTTGIRRDFSRIQSS